MTLTNKAHEELLSHSNPKTVVVMFLALFPPIPLGIFAFSQAELASLLNAAASLPYPHNSLWQLKTEGQRTLVGMEGIKVSMDCFYIHI